MNRILAVPAEQEADLWPETNLGGAPDNIQDHSFTVDFSVLQSINARFAVLADGVFAFDDIADGEYLVCLARKELDDPTVLVEGCDRHQIVVPSSLDIRWVTGRVDVLGTE